VEKMTHNTLESSEILILEQKILSVFNFRIYKKMTLFETVELLFVKFNLHLTKYFDKLCNIVNYIAKIILFDFELMTQYSVKYLAASCFYISIKIVNQISPRLDPKKFVKKINIFLKLNENKFYICSKLLLELSKNFKNKFPFASNLEKYDAFNI
jgi:cyclin B/cyclin A